MRVSDLPRVMRGYGLTVVEVAGCYGRGNEFPSRPDGALRHWTAGGPGAKPSLGVVTNGRGGSNPLPGPLAQTLQSRERDVRGLDVVYFIADGKANHAGTGTWNGISGNYKLLGNEIEWSGPSEAFPASRILTSELIARAMLDVCTGSNDDDVAEHREYATPAGRKIDTNLDGNVLRRRMRELRTQPSPTNPNPGDDGEMPYLLLKGETSAEWWITDGITKRHVQNREHAGQLVYVGLAKWDGTKNAAFTVPQNMVDQIPTVGEAVRKEFDKHVIEGQLTFLKSVYETRSKVEGIAKIVAEIKAAGGSAGDGATAEQIADELAERLQD